MTKHQQFLLFAISLSLFVGCGKKATLENNPYVDCNHSSQISLATMASFGKESESSTQNWVIMGSSSAAGAGAQGYQNSWAGKLQKELEPNGVDVINIAHGGDTTYEALDSACEVDSARRKPRPGHNLDAALEYKPDVTIISYPSNDAALGYSAEETVFNILRIRSMLHKLGSRVLVISSQPRPMSSNKVNTSFHVDEMLSYELRECFVEVYSKLTTSDDTLKPEYDFDTVHMNDAGHELVFNEIMKVINSEKCVAN